MQDELKVRDKLLETCGCEWTVVELTKRDYRLRHKNGDFVYWSKGEIHRLMKTGRLVKVLKEQSSRTRKAR